MTTENPYAPPESRVEDQSPVSMREGSLRGGIAGEYDFSIEEIIKESWVKTQGMKGTFWVAAIIVLLALIIVGVVLETLFGESPGGEPFTAAVIIKQILSQLISAAVTYPLMAGIFMLGVHRAAQRQISINMAFSYFGYVIPLSIVGVLVTVLSYIGFMLLVLPGIYLAIAYMLVIPLVLDKQLSPWQAMEASRKAITHHWFKAFFLFLLTGVIMLVSLIPLGLGLIWTYPMAVNVMGILYREIFGIEGA
jgi:hypothetical protein